MEGLLRLSDCFWLYTCVSKRENEKWPQGRRLCDPEIICQWVHVLPVRPLSKQRDPTAKHGIEPTRRTETSPDSLYYFSNTHTHTHLHVPYAPASHCYALFPRPRVCIVGYNHKLCETERKSAFH